MRQQYLAYFFLVLLVLLSGVSFFWTTPVDLLENLIDEHTILAAGAFTGIMFLTTVVAPLTSLPLVPLVSPVFGPFVTGILAIVGWTFGAVVAFLIARYAGRPILGKFVSLQSLDRYERLIPREARFLTVFALRMIIPVDVLSYALGIFSSISLLEYTLATVLGIAWFAFAFSYLGDAAFKDNVELFVIVGVGSLIVFGLSAWYVIQQVNQNNRD